jgi:outer membrane immunogenic protein
MLRGLYYAVLGIATILGALVASPFLPEARAAGFTGCYGGGAVGWSSALSDTSLDTAFGSLSVDALAADGASFTALAGCDIALGNTPFVVGLWGDWTKHSAEFSVNATGLPAIVETGLDTSWAVGGRLGYVVVPGALVYALGGYTQAEVDDITFPAFGPGAPVLSVPTLEGYVLGGGAEVSLGNGLYLQAQYSYADYEQVDIALTPGLSLGLDTDVQTARVGLLYRFDMGRDELVIPAIDAPAAAAPTKHKPLK